ncbi:terminase TerL endonuclease subunit [[Mycoplasma] gypis]|uniref:Terminase TerL endonuclease subunit n=1 Tax=[Mycoplasma] gypis TaxID=92404 RepID=A0ABZ2RSH2_9BACT|nr:terminase TerL endonuclease subunit [[Mycoplasma] gypis]MBN0919425.1 terminase large subunit [[Mycoplasma] gypis]
MTTNYNHPELKKAKQWANNNYDATNDEPTQYALKVINNEIVTSEMIFLQCLRHILFLYKFHNEPEFPFAYTLQNYEKIKNFTKKIIIPQTNKPFIFAEFRKFMTGFVFGWVFKNNPEQYITNEVFDVEARKQWKSSYWAMIALATTRGILHDGNSEVYFCGATRESSRIPYDIALNYIFKSPKIKKKFLKYNTIRILSTKRGQIKAIPFDTAALEGKNPSLVVLTEYHLHKDDTMQKSAKYAKNNSRKNLLIIYDTTKGTNIDSVCYRREKDYKEFLRRQILNPEKVDENYNIFLFAAELDEEDIKDWQNPKNWIKANPGLGVTVSLEDLQKEYAQITTVSAANEFKVKRLGIWVNNESAFFTINDILQSQQKNADFVKKLALEDFRDFNCLMGVDLSSTNDTTAVVLNWEIPQPDGEPLWVFKGHGFIPQKSVATKEVKDGAFYRDWAKNKFLTITEGDVINYGDVINKIIEYKQKYQPSQLLYDPWQFYMIKRHLLDNNIFYEDQTKQVKQGVYLSPFFRQFEIKLKKQKIYIMDDNKLMFSHILNVATKETNQGNIFIKKIAQNKRIDQFIAMLVSASARDVQASQTVKDNYYKIIE